MIIIIIIISLCIIITYVIILLSTPIGSVYTDSCIIYCYTHIIILSYIIYLYLYIILLYLSQHIILCYCYYTRTYNIHTREKYKARDTKRFSSYYYNFVLLLPVIYMARSGMCLRWRRVRPRRLRCRCSRWWR